MHGLGACLIQEGHPVAYAPRSLTPTEVQYGQMEKELLAIVFAMEKFETYLPILSFTSSLIMGWEGSVGSYMD